MNKRIFDKEIVSISLITTIIFVISIVFLVGGVWLYLNEADENVQEISKSAGADPPKFYKIVAAGDFSCAPTEKVTDSNCRSANVFNQIRNRQFDAMLLLGDLQYESGEKTAFDNVFGAQIGDLKSKSYAVTGNHEFGTKNAAGFFDFWNNEKQVGKRGEGYFSFDIGAWHVIALNSNCEFVGGCSLSSPQGMWLKSDLEKHVNTKCTLAFWHHPRFTSGKYKTDQAARDLSKDFWQLLYNSGTDIILNGHDHVYERFKSLDANGQPDNNGIRQFTVGSGGKSHYAFIEPHLSNSEFGDDKNFGALELVLYDDLYQWLFFDETGRAIDNGSGNCH